MPHRCLSGPQRRSVRRAVIRICLFSHQIQINVGPPSIIPTVIRRTAARVAHTADAELPFGSARKPLESPAKAQRAASTPLCRPIDAACRIVFKRPQVLLDAALSLLARLVLGARDRVTDSTRGTREPSIACVKTGAKQRQGDYLRHGTPPGPIDRPNFWGPIMRPVLGLTRGEVDCALIQLEAKPRPKGARLQG